MTRRFTGRHATAIIASFFGVVIVVNLIMASFATSTFGGIVVENTYVASQEFNGWLEQAEEQKALGWDAVTTWRPDNRLAVRLTGVPAGAEVKATARHPVGRAPDQQLTFSAIADDRFLSHAPLGDGRWYLRLEVNAAGKTWRRQEELR
ncbi:MAG TPA: FixH family protein [Croceibacterium sp.]|nr:FixH family protein [Croceibacterium sp.]